MEDVVRPLTSRVPGVNVRFLSIYTFVHECFLLDMEIITVFKDVASNIEIMLNVQNLYVYCVSDNFTGLVCLILKIVATFMPP